MGYSFLCPFAHSRDFQILSEVVIEGQGILSVGGSGNSVRKIFRLVGIGVSGQCNGIPTGERRKEI